MVGHLLSKEEAELELEVGAGDVLINGVIYRLAMIEDSPGKYWTRLEAGK